MTQSHLTHHTTGAPIEVAHAVKWKTPGQKNSLTAGGPRGCLCCQRETSVTRSSGARFEKNSMLQLQGIWPLFFLVQTKNLQLHQGYNHVISKCRKRP